MRSLPQQAQPDNADERNDPAERLRRAYVAHALDDTLPRRRQQGVKRALDLACALPLFIASLPLRLVVALSLRVRWRQAAVVTSRCAGRGGRPFPLRQFRVAPGEPTAESASAASAWLSAARLGKLPALWNILTGELSLVGPAPLTCAACMRCPIDKLARLYVAPGALSLRPVGRLRQATSQTEADLRYITQGSLWMDLQQIWAAVFLPNRRFSPAPPSHDGRADAGSASDMV